MSTTTVKGSGVTNNKAIVIFGGNGASGGPVTTSPGMSYKGHDASNTPYVQGTGDAASYGMSPTGLNASATWDMDADNPPLVKGGHITSDLGDVAYEGLQGPGNPVQQMPIHYREGRKTVIVSGWNYATGAITGSSISDDNFGQDHAARPTRAIPGEFVYMGGNKGVPNQADYSAKTCG